MEMDSEGNVYIFGAYGQMMSIDTTYLPTAGGTDNTRGSFLAKFNCQGELQWTKAVRCQQFDASSNWMQIKNDTIYIMGDVRFKEPYNTYFLDSLIYATELEWPYTFPWIDGNWYNYFTKLDLDGNNLCTKFLWKGMESSRFWENHMLVNSPFYISNSNNYYLLGLYNDVFYLWDNYQYYVDTTPITDSLYFDIKNNYLLFKFNANFGIQWFKPLIDSISTSVINPRTKINFMDITADSDDNMYYVGKAVLLDSTEQNYPPGTLYLADGHTIEFQQHGKDIGFVMKIDSAGTIQWVEQMYRFAADTLVAGVPNSGGQSTFLSIDIDENNEALYISGTGNARNNQSVDIYHSIFPNGDIFEAPCYDCSGTYDASYLLALNKDDGSVLWHSTPYTEAGNDFGNVEYANDSLYVGLRWGYGLNFGDTLYTHDGTKDVFVGFSHLTYNTAGELCSVRNLRTDDGWGVWANDTKVDAAGNIWFTGIFDADLDFEGDTSLYTSNRSMFLARYGKNCPVHLDSTAILCHGEAVQIGGQTYNNSGTYTALIENPGGDTIINLGLETLPALSSGLPADTTACLNNSFLLTATAGYETYLWQDGSTGQSYSQTYSTVQTDTLTISMGKTFNTAQGNMYCEWTDTIIVSAEICSSYELQQQASLALYPNPASSSTELVFPATQNASLLLYDNSSRLVQQKQVSGSSYTLNLSNLDKGIYHIKLISNEYNLSKKLIVK